MRKNVLQCTILHTWCTTITATSFSIPFSSGCSLCLTIDVVARTCNRSILQYHHTLSGHLAWILVFLSTLQLSTKVFIRLVLTFLSFVLMVRLSHSVQPHTWRIVSWINSFRIGYRIPRPPYSSMVGPQLSSCHPSSSLASEAFLPVTTATVPPAHFRSRLEPINSLSITVHYCVREGRGFDSGMRGWNYYG